MNKPWIQTFTGRPFFLFEPKELDFAIVDIAHALSLQCRFNGAVKHFYSVAEHSVRCSILLEEWGEPNEIIFAGLMHDAAEAYIGDLVWPVKRDLEAFGDLEHAIEQKLFARFGLPAKLPDVVKKADLVLLHVERDALLEPPPIPWNRGEPEQPNWTIETETSWRCAKANFLDRFYKYRLIS